MTATHLSLADFKGWLRDMRRLFPTEMPVRVSRRPLRKDCGRMYVYDDHYAITISSTLDRQATSDTLLHEWSHILTGEDTGDYESHSPAFWERHGEIYRTWHETE